LHCGTATPVAFQSRCLVWPVKRSTGSMFF
jgi:hypothetical protein